MRRLSMGSARISASTPQLRDSPVFTVGNEFTRVGVHGAQSAIACCLSVFTM